MEDDTTAAAPPEARRPNGTTRSTHAGSATEADGAPGATNANETVKTLTFVVPAFNMETYLVRCVNSLTSGTGDDVEVLIVDDGSSDGTPRMADRLAARHPETVRAIHQHNKGHGGAVNTGISHARGEYIKVVDADDWVETESLNRLLATLREQSHADEPIDMVVTDYVYDKAGKRNKHVVRFRRVMKPDMRLRWDDLHHFGIAQYLIMHALTFRTTVLRQAHTTLPEHTFYVDFIYSYQPLPWVRTLMYLDTPLYHYFIGREGQSVQTDVMVKRVDQLVRVNHLMSEATPAPGSVAKGLYHYMIHFLSINSVVTSVFLILSRKSENYAAKRKLWQDMRQVSPAVARDVRRQLPSRAINLPGATGRWIIRCGYRVAKGFIGFN